MLTVAVYHQSVPNQKNQEKVDLLKNFSIGVKTVGDKCIDVNYCRYQNTDVGVIQGWTTGTDDVRKHLALRKTVIDTQIKNNRYVLTADSNLFLYADTTNPHHYLRYSLNGIFPNTGIYFDTNLDPIRWAKISRDLNIRLKPYRTNGDHILLCLQRNGGWSMDGYHVLNWAAATIIELREHTDRPIVVRPHPGDKKAREYIGDFKSTGDLSNVQLSAPGTPLVEDLKNCWAAVNYNSSPTVGAIIEGIPIFVTDPQRSQCREVANTDLSQIENPTLFDREPWAHRLAMSHWKFTELADGSAWRHMRSFVKVVPQ